jgi:TAP-like protein
VLDSPTAPGADIPRADVTSQLDALSRMFAKCAADAECAAAYPDLKARFLRLVERLDKQPLPLEGGLKDALGDAITGKRLVEITVSGLQNPVHMPRMPAFINAVDKGDAERIAMIVDVPTSPEVQGYDLPGFSLGLQLSIYCGELHYSEMDKGPAATNEAWPKLISDHLVPDYYKFCKSGLWPIKPIDRSLMAQVDSAIPTLVLLGEQDPITSRTEADRALRGLQKGRLIVVPETTHGTTEAQPCAAKIMTAFINGLDSPPNTACLQSIPPLRYSTKF